MDFVDVFGSTGGSTAVLPTLPNQANALFPRRFWQHRLLPPDRLFGPRVRAYPRDACQTSEGGFDGGFDAIYLQTTDRRGRPVPVFEQLFAYGGKQYRVGLRPNRKTGKLVKFCEPLPRPGDRVRASEGLRALKAWSRSLDRRAGHA
jgi:hypothetical protein